MSGTVALAMPDEGQKAIMDVAAQCFMERGYHATSIDDVARRLGSTKGRVYHFFASKADLLFAVSEYAMEMNFQAIEEARKLEGTPLDRFRALAMAHTTAMIEKRPYQNAVWQGVEIHLRGATTPEQRQRLEAILARRTEYSSVFRTTLEEVHAAGDVSYDNISITMQIMFMTLNSPIFWYKPRDGETYEDRLAIARQCVDYALYGLSARSGAA